MFQTAWGTWPGPSGTRGSSRGGRLPRGCTRGCEQDRALKVSLKARPQLVERAPSPAPRRGAGDTGIGVGRARAPAHKPFAARGLRWCLSRSPSPKGFVQPRAQDLGPKAAQPFRAELKIQPRKARALWAGGRWGGGGHLSAVCTLELGFGVRFGPLPKPALCLENALFKSSLFVFPLPQIYVKINRVNSMRAFRAP